MLDFAKVSHQHARIRGNLSGLTGEGLLRDHVDRVQLTVVQAFDRMRPRASSWTADINPVGFYDRWATPLGFCHCPHQG